MVPAWDIRDMDVVYDVDIVDKAADQISLVYLMMIGVKGEADCGAVDFAYNIDTLLPRGDEIVGVIHEGVQAFDQQQHSLAVRDGSRFF